MTAVIQSQIHYSDDWDENNKKFYFVFKTGDNDDLEYKIRGHFEDYKKLPSEFMEWYSQHYNMANDFDDEEFINTPWGVVTDFSEYEANEKVPEREGLSSVEDEKGNLIDASIIVIPYLPDELSEFYNLVSTPITKSAYKTASALLKQTRGDIEAAAQLLSKYKF